MRTITTAQDTLEATSLETYLRGELGTYSERTLGLYATHISALAAAGENITEQTMRFTVALSGFASLAQAEAEAEAEAGPAPSGRPI